MAPKPTYEELEQRIKEIEKEAAAHTASGPSNANLEEQVRLRTAELEDANKALREIQAQFEAVYDHHYQMTGLIDKEGRLLMGNRTALEFAGVEAQDVVGKHFWETPWWSHSQKEQRKLREAMARAVRGEMSHFESTHVSAAGEMRNIDFRLRPVFDDNGEVTYLVPEGYDITERIQAEESLRVSEEKYRTFFQNSCDAMFILRNGLFADCNTAAAAALGYADPEEIVDLNPLDVSPEYQSDGKRSSVKVKEMMETAYALGTHRFEWKHRRKNGDLFPVEVALTAMPSEEGMVLLAVWRDITERKRAEEALRESESFSSSLLNNSPTPILVVNQDSTIRHINPAFEILTGYSTEEVHGNKAPHPWWINDPRSADFDERREAILKGTPKREKLFRKKSGEDFWAETTTTPIIKDGKFQYALTTWIDITERKCGEDEKERLEVQLVQAQKMEAIGTLAGGVAHDFNNILSPIMIHSEMAMLDLHADNPLQHNLEEIYKAGERAKELVKQILTFSRKEEGKRAKIKITPILKDACKMLRAAIPTTIDIQQSFETESDYVLADPTQIHQIILNLCTNAAYAMREKGGTMSVSLVQKDVHSETSIPDLDLNPGPYLKLTVSDTGTGMDDETIKRVFEPYFTTKDPDEGTGMGLALIHGIIKSYEGDITVESELYKGTTFNVYLPSIEAGVSPIEKSSTIMPRGTERILLVDDEKVLVDLIQDMLESLGYKVTGRTSSIEALEIFRDNPGGFDLVITDMTMPNMTGKDLAKELMFIRSDIPIILCTGFSEHIDEKRAKELGISAFILKPIIMGDIANNIREVLDKNTNQ